jgi:hypothetical protein
MRSTMKNYNKQTDSLSVLSHGEDSVEFTEYLQLRGHGNADSRQHEIVPTNLKLLQ